MPTSLLRFALTVVAVVTLLPLPILAQTTNAPPARTGLASVPTTRILAIGRLTPAATPSARREVMPDEVRQTIALYLSGKIDQWYVRQDLGGVVFIMNTSDLREAHALLEQLPLGRAGLMEFDLIPLGPLSPLGLLAAPMPPSSDR